MTGEGLWEQYRAVCREFAHEEIPTWNQVPWMLKIWWASVARHVRTRKVVMPKSDERVAKVQALRDGAKTPGERAAAEAALKRISKAPAADPEPEEELPETPAQWERMA